MRVIRDKEVIEDNWQYYPESEETPPPAEVDAIVPYKYWAANRDELKQRPGKIAVCLEGDDPVETFAKDLAAFELVGVMFPMYKDGRCYSHARLLRDRYEFKGEIRALGDVLRDQLFYMQRCGINGYALKEGKDYEDALKGLTDFSLAYQPAADDAVPISKNR